MKFLKGTACSVMIVLFSGLICGPGDIIIMVTIWNMDETAVKGAVNSEHVIHSPSPLL